MALGTGCGSPTGPTADEGPWHIKVSGAEIGRLFDTQPANSVWNEYFERRATGWAWPSANGAWDVSVSSTTYGSTQPNCVANATYQTCQRTKNTRVVTGSTSPSEWFTPDATTTGNAVDVVDYYPTGKYEILATWTSKAAGSVPVTKKADFYVYANSNNDEREEKICAEPGFLWVARENLARTAITWTITWKSTSAPPVNCPGAWKTHRYTIDLDP